MANPRGRYFIKWDEDHAIQFKSKIYPPCEPTFLPAQTYLDICIADTRLEFINLIDDKLGTISHDSDHKAILMEIKLQERIQLESEEPKNPIPLYKKTKWNKFGNNLNRAYLSEVPDDRNLSKEEIDSFLDTINDAIKIFIENTVPKATSRIRSQYYLTNKIKKLQKLKSNTLTLLHRLQRNNNIAQISATKLLLKNIRNEIQNEITNNIERHWEKTLNKVNHRDPQKFFPIINKVFRPKNRTEIPNLHLNEAERNLTLRCSINITNTVNSEIIIEDQQEKVNIFEAYYESINSPRHLNSNTRLREIIDAQTTQFKTEYDASYAAETTITNFGPDNKAYGPPSEVEGPITHVLIM
ncbi:hypothetical protein KQX54_010072 [Cotesia glomerata]|uniref:Reverse transcriptase domain-containing protein n=1 Tax=Cotesia glomerata TaxID=32391 RepID=A0AAV7IU66_COTGL|nr:hypothetical protein KQX54_010072 [Cotesia glomerata]